MDSDQWVGPYDALDDGYTDGELDFNPPTPGRLPYAGQRLVVRYGPVSEAVVEPPWHYAYALVDERRIRPTKFIQDALFTSR